MSSSALGIETTTSSVNQDVIKTLSDSKGLVEPPHQSFHVFYSKLLDGQATFAKIPLMLVKRGLVGLCDCLRLVPTILAAGCNTCICFKIVAPSFVIVTSPFPL